MNASYICPHCQTIVNLGEPPQGGKVICSGCWQDFDISGQQPTEASLQIEKIPFFKGARRKLLEQKLEELIEDGELSLSDKTTLLQIASQLKLAPHELDELQTLLGQREAQKVPDRVASTLHVTDQDLSDLEAIQTKFGLDDIKQDEGFRLARQVYLLEEKGDLPPPYAATTGILLEPGEKLYFQIASEWGQLRASTGQYSGFSVSIPTGIKGVRFRMGQLISSRNEHLAQLSLGTLYVTDSRLVFLGDKRNTTIPYSRILDLQLFSDSLCVKTSKQKADFFMKEGLHVKYVSALVWRLRQAA